MEFLTDGQHKHGGEKLHCFFCLKHKEHCQHFRLNESPDHPAEYKPLYGQRFVCCPECYARGPEYLATSLTQWLKIQDILGDAGLGIKEIEQHKTQAPMDRST